METGNDNLKKCSFCRMDIPSNASRCPFCSSLLDVKVDNGYYSDNREDNNISSVNDEEPAEYTFIPKEKAPEEKIPETRPEFRYAAPGQDDRANYQQNYQQNYSAQIYNRNSREPLSNGMKVFLTVLFTIIPGLGQLAGIITAIVFMNSDDDRDRKSFGVALLVASIIMFVLACIGCFVLALAFSMNNGFDYNGGV